MSTSMRFRNLSASQLGWGDEKTLRPLTLIIIVILASTVATTIHLGKASNLLSRGPISIVGNAGLNYTLNPGNGVTSGNGSTANPYLIEGWDISAPTTADGIHIEQTNVTLIIRNVNVHGMGQENGIFLYHVSHVLVNDTAISSLNDGITLILSNATVENSLISSNAQHGINILDSENISVINNTIKLNSGDGIQSDSCITCLLNVTGNMITFNLSGIILESMNNSFISQNSILTNTHKGIGVYQSTYVLIDLNNITSNEVGVDLGGSTDSLVHHNNFLYNSVQALDNETGKNMWDVGYASGGNYWSDYTGVDRCSGPAQNVCTKSDGIGDTPYIFVNGQDRYALMKLFVQTVIHDVAVSSITPSAMSVNQSQTLSIAVVVTNKGAATENFTLTLYYGSTLIGSQTILPLDPDVSQTVLFDWNTTGVTAGPHALKAVASTVWGEIDVADNTLTTGPVEVKIPQATTPTPPSPPPTQPSTSPDYYLVGGLAALFIISILAVMTRRTRHRTR
jgi:parallel beta-helix repeat protein